MMEKLQQLPQLSDVSSDWQDKGLVAMSMLIATAPAVWDQHGGCR
ncbi:hypothetical protein ACLK1X_11800 [Escherichia coli]